MKTLATTPAMQPVDAANATMCQKWRAFRQNTSGVVSTEFVIILPAFLMLFVLITSASMLLVTSSEVQQVSFELTRGSLRYYEPGITSDALCADVETKLAPGVLANGNFVSAERFTNISCNMDDTSGDPSVAISVTYDLSNSPALMLGGLIGINIGAFTRSSQMWY